MNNQSQKKSLHLSPQQEQVFLDYEHLIPITISRCVNFDRIDSAIDRDDLYQVGSIALVRAIQTVDPSKNFKAYAIKLIRNALKNALKARNNNESLYMLHLSVDHTEDDKSIIADISAPNEYIPEYSFEQSELISQLLQSKINRYTGTKRIGLLCIELFTKGYSLSECASILGVDRIKVAACVSEARKVLLRSKDICEALGIDVI